MGAGNAFGCAVGMADVLCRVVWWGSGRAEGGVAGVGLAVVGGSGCLAVLVDESAAGGVSSDGWAGPACDDVAIVGCALPESAVGPADVVVRDVLAQELLRLSTVPDQGAVAQFAAHGADPPFRVRAGGRIGG